MEKTEKREKMIRSIEEFEKKYLPNRVEEKNITPEDAREFAINLANEAIKKIKIKPF